MKAENKVRKRRMIAALVTLFSTACIIISILFITLLSPDSKNGQESAVHSSTHIDTTNKGSKIQAGSHIFFGTYEQDNDASNGKEDIEWLVLANEGDKALLISQYGLDGKPYADNLNDTLWETCSLRKWLNEEFIDIAFSPEEQSRIISSAVTADKNPKYSTSPGNDTTDKVFLLSISEVEKYFSSYSDRPCHGTAYCHAQGTIKSSITGYCWWWLRTPGDTPIYVVVIEDDGTLELGGDRVTLGGQAVRPAMWIDTKDL